MAVVEKTIDIIGDAAFCNMILSRKIPEGLPVDIYDEAVRILRNYALRGMSGLQSLHMPNVTTCNYYSLHDCASLKTVIMENCTRVEERAFQGCYGLETVTMPKLTFIGTCGFAGSGTSQLTELEFPELLTLSELGLYTLPRLTRFVAPKLKSLSNSAFYADVGLTQLDFPSLQTVYGSPFSNCANLEVINFGPNLTSVSSNMLKDTPAGIVVNLPFEEGHFSAAPWGNADAVINYGVPYSGDVPMPT